MNPEFVPSSKLVRSASAAIAVLTTVLVIGFIDRLATRFGDQVLVATDRPVVIAGS